MKNGTKFGRVDPASLRAFTIVELLVVVSIISLLIALLLPAIQRGRDKALITQSVSNLKNLASACEVYAGDWADRQFTAISDDFGTATGASPGARCTSFIASTGCPPIQILGFDSTTGDYWGYDLPNTGKCARNPKPGNCNAINMYIPIDFNPNHITGSFREPGMKAFHDYLNGRYYDPLLYAPKDVVPLSKVEMYFQLPDEFTYDGVNYEPSSYCFSPAAMYDPTVFGRGLSTAPGLNAPDFSTPDPSSGMAPAAYKSPANARCTYPTLKTRMIEHNWLQNPPDSLTNPGIAGGETAWFFNAGYNSAPASMFFDGHIELVQCMRAQQGEQRAGKLWSRLTPFGSAGYYGNQSYDFLVDTSFHILTRFGIEGRDVLGAEG